MRIILKKVKVHNLKSVDLTLDPHQLIVFSGVSGSGKSSLAFDTIYVEGQRRYIESLSPYARRHMGEMRKPDAELITGITPTIAIQQKAGGQNPRSTVGTLTEIYDYLRVLFARVGIAHCPISGERVTPQSVEQIINGILTHFENQRIIFLAPYAKAKKGEFKDDFAELLRQGFTRVRLDGEIIELGGELAIDPNLNHTVDVVIDRLQLDDAAAPRLTEAVTRGLDQGKGVMSALNPDTKEELLYSQHAFAKKSGLSYPPLDPQDFSFNHPSGMCPTCQGLGSCLEYDLDLVIDPNLSIAEDCCRVASSYTTVRYKNIYDNLAKIYKFSVDTPWKKLSEPAKKVFLYGTDTKWTRMRFVHPVKKSTWMEFIAWRGVLNEAKSRFIDASHPLYIAKMKELMHESICPECHGAKIKPYPAATQVGGKRIAEVTALSIDQCHKFFDALKLSKEELKIGGELLKEIRERLQFLKNVGLHYLNLERTAPTLSGGESQRVRLASQIGSGLVGVTYILDEPSIGLHPRDNLKLLETLKRLRDKGNTVIVVEHDEETMCEADYIVDVGPLAGQNGGQIVATGSLEDIKKCKASITGGYLSGRLSIPIPKKRRKAQGFLKLEKASHHNLKNVTVQIPLGVFTAITGVSGSGKSSLISDTLYPALSNKLMKSRLTVGKHKTLVGADQLDKVIAIDQTSIGRTPRSNPATYVKLFDEIRDLFSQLPESEAQGYKPGRFSFNVKEGSCPQCGGMGMTKVDMDFLDDEWVTCEHCDGKRFDSATLSVLYKGKNIYDILEMTVLEAQGFFAAIPHLKAKLDLLMEVGLDYIKIGQPSPTLSGGEAQRIKLAKELSRKDTGRTLYILDEPTTGLHFHDISKLIGVLQALVDRGNSVLVIEHNTDLIKTSDWILELGPEGGDEGGKLIASGTPEQIAKLDTPTAEALNATYLKEAKKTKAVPMLTHIEVEGAAQNNLKKIHASIPRGEITVCTGPSGSGKSSFAFDTLYAEGQRRYIESLSSYARQFVKQMPKPKLERIEGLMASIAIEQKSHAGNPRSTVGTQTEIYDYLRILYAHLGIAYCPETGEKIETISKDYVVEKLLELPAKSRLHILSPLQLRHNETFENLKERLQKEGFLRIRLNNTYYELDQEIPYDRLRLNTLFLVIDRLAVQPEVHARLFQAVDQATTLSGGTLVADCEGKDLYHNLAFAVASTGKSYPPITPHTFSFNTSQGMCPECEGLGIRYGANLTRHAPLMKLSAAGLIRELWKEEITREGLKLFISLLEEEGVDTDTALHELEPQQLQILFNGSNKPENHKGMGVSWRGINAALALAAKSAPKEVKDSLLPLLDESPCISCEGSRLNPLARHVKIGNLSIANLCELPIDESIAFLKKLKTPQLLEETLDQIQKRLFFLQTIGLGYLSLARSAPTLSGGEAQRIRLARQLGSGLTSCLYVLDEPTIGLHPHDNEKLNTSLLELKKMGNTLVLVEHDPLTLAIADYILDFGPEAGIHGGEIMARGTLKQIKANPNSLTGQYLSGKKSIPIPSKRRPVKTSIELRNVSIHNIKNLTIDFPLGLFTCLTGVSGSGKSTLMHDILKPYVQERLAQRKPLPVDKLIVIDQNPIGQTQRADVSTYVDLLSPLRTFFASIPAAKVKGLFPKNFSYNHRKGMCPTCQGLGSRTVYLQFLPPVKVTCEACHGLRLNPLSLSVPFRGKNLGEILQLTVTEAREFLITIPKVMRLLDTLIAVGLGYLQLGQEIATLSGGEAQRLRLSRELGKRSTGKTLYLFDEPTIGLHSADIAKLLPIFRTLVDQGNTLILIEHNLDMIANADYLIDLGPGAGKAGGSVVALGTPEEVAAVPQSLTGKYLKAYFANSMS